MELIQVNNLKYRYPHTKALALKGISFEVKAGEFVGIVGANKAGKSTLTQALVGLVPQFYKGAYGGSVLVDGLDAAKEPVSKLCQKVGLVFQNPFNQLSGAKETVYEEIAFGLQNLGIDAIEMKRRIDEALKLLDIYEYRDRNPFDLSGGQMQRVAIASILVMEPEVLVLDEPTSQLDPAGTGEVFEAVLRLAKAGKTIIVVEQKLELLAKYCDRLLLLNEGELVADGSVKEIFSRDDLKSYNVVPPIYTQIAKSCGVFADREKGLYPATYEELLQHKDILRNNISLIEDTYGTGAISKENISEDITRQELFTIDNLSFAYTKDRYILRNFSLKLDNRATAIIGQNGAGKTTLVKILKGLLVPEEGEVLYKNNSITDYTVASLAKEVGYIFQNPDDQIFKNKVIEEVMFGPLNIGMSKEAAILKALEALDIVGLKNSADMNPYDLELSDRKLVAIASVVAMDPKVIIFDEPTIAQDYKGKEIIKKLIDTLKSQGKLVIAILHDMDFVAASFDRVIAMAKGRILADSDAKGVFEADGVMKLSRVEAPHYMKVLKGLE